MLLRVALTSFVEAMGREGALGTDEMGENLRLAYLSTGRGILNIILN